MPLITFTFELFSAGIELFLMMLYKSRGSTWDFTLCHFLVCLWPFFSAKRGTRITSSRLFARACRKKKTWGKIWTRLDARASEFGQHKPCLVSYLCYFWFIGENWVLRKLFANGFINKRFQTVTCCGLPVRRWLHSTYNYAYIFLRVKDCVDTIDLKRPTYYFHFRWSCFI